MTKKTKTAPPEAEAEAEAMTYKARMKIYHRRARKQASQERHELAGVHADMDRQLAEKEARQRRELFTEILPFSEAVARAHSAVVDEHSGLTTDAAHSTMNILYPFELAKVLATRTAQLAEGAPTFLPGRPYLYPMDYTLVAQKELRMKLLPFLVRRRLACDRYEYFPLAQMLVLEELEVDLIDFDAMVAQALRAQPPSAT